MEAINNASFLLYLLLASTLYSRTKGGDTLTPSQPLADNGETLISSSGSFELGFFSPAAGSKDRYVGIWYRNISVQTVVWVANRQRPVTGQSGQSGRLSLTINGTLVIADENSTVVWSSNSPALADPAARLLDNGNFVVSGSRDVTSSYAWQSFDFPTDTLLPDMKLGWNLTSGHSSNLTAWASATDPAPGRYATAIDPHGDPQIYLWAGMRQFFRGGPWNGLRFSGIQEINKSVFNTFSFDFIVDSKEITYSFHSRDRSILSRLTMHHSGVLQRLVWIESSKLWNVMWLTPRDQCDNMLSPCGPYGVCYPSRSPMCNCLLGFRPKSLKSWDLRDGTGGCERSSELDCRNGTDGFVVLSGAKLPDTSRSTVNRSMNLEQCRALCLRNCSCKAYASANISGEGSGCIIWITELTDIKAYDGGGQDLYVRLAFDDLGLESTNSQRSRRVIIILIPALAILLLLCAAFCIWRRKKTSQTNSDHSAYTEEAVEEDDFDLPLLGLAAIMDTTDNFSLDNKLGQGGYGPVYKGKLWGEQEIAVKRLSKTSTQGLHEFKNEVTLIAKLQHRNLVRLLGCCIQSGERMLIYEYMHNGSLDTFLFDKNKGKLLGWKTRYNIILGIARGLLYLHEDSRLRIIHRDLKASNILLDEDMIPKISDFGMAKIFGGDETIGNTKRVVGTYGYMSPEYAMDGIFSMKSDVFSFGVLILEIISGRRNRGVYQSTRHLNLLGHIWSLWKEDKGLDLVDASIGHPIPTDEVLKCIKIGLLCVQERPENRPTMSSIVLMLGSNSFLLPEPRQPGFVIGSKYWSENDSSPSKKDSSVNQVSVTILEGR
ncbi:receptor-like serine/threonine-protein kinase SD1-8 isoform X2 [Canna indica]|uniref:Receptor-like serine/threonine-protein kinase n=1 Tax=Canna indica TaxID=4628 RepID=A0AAQ3KGD1_9LILI|nr:receptor-like serine/threonine-protein kinase SD1-8 isoform X2 [Canna indica]